MALFYKMKPVFKTLIKLGITLIALVLIGFGAIYIYLSNPALINRTLPVWLEVDSEGYRDHPTYAQAISFNELQARYSFQAADLAGVKRQAEADGIRLKHQGHVIRRMISDGPRERRREPVPPFSERLLGYQILMLKAFPNPEIDLIISKHKWFDYYLVLEIASD